MQYKVVLSLSLWIKLRCVTIQRKAIEQYFFVDLFIMLYNVVLTWCVTIEMEAIEKHFHPVQSSYRSELCNLCVPLRVKTCRIVFSYTTLAVLFRLVSALFL